MQCSQIIPNKNGIDVFQITPKETPEKTKDDENDLFAKTRIFFIVGRLIGVVPFSGVFRKSYTNVTFAHVSLASFVSIAIIVLLALNLLLEFRQAVRVPKRNAVEIATAVKSPVFYGFGLFVYIYFYVRARKFLNLFHVWAKARTFYSTPDKNLTKDVLLISFITLTSAFLENGVLHLKYFQTFDNLNDVVMLGYKEQLGRIDEHSSILEIYYRRLHYDWSSVLGYTEVYAVLIFVANKWTLYTWNYIDLFIGVCGRAIYFKFKSLYEVARDKLTKSRAEFLDPTIGTVTSQDQWLQIVKDHEQLCALVKEFEKVLSPLIFISYVINVFYICMQIYMGLHSEDSGPRSIIHSIYAPWSLIHLALRICIVSITLARVNVYAHKIMDVIIECPIEYYDKNISRLDRRVVTGPLIGFTGLGCFSVTKPFIIKIISVVFTFEIVLLQGSATTGEHQCCCKINA